MERSPDLLQPVFAAVRKWIHNPALNVGYSIEAPDEPTHQFSNKGRFGKTTACSSFCGGLTAKPAVRKNVLPAFTAVAAATVLLARVPTCDGACLGTGTTLAKEAWRARPFFWQVASCAPTARSVAPRWATTSRHVVRRMLAVRGRWRAGRPRRAATCFRRWPVGFSVGPMGGDAPRSSGPGERSVSGGFCYAHSTWTPSNPPRATRSVVTIVARARQVTTSSTTAPSNGDTGSSVADVADVSIPK